MGLTKYYRDQSGNYIGGFNGSVPPNGVECPPPANASQKWDFTNNTWIKENKNEQ